MSKEILAGSANQTIHVFIQDSSSSTGDGLTGLAYNSSGLVCYYKKGATGTVTALSLATQTNNGAHSDGGFVEVNSSNMPGVYRLDLSDAMVDTAGLLTIILKGATNMAPCPIEIEVVAVNKYDAVRFGITALPNAAADAEGGLPISDAGGLDLDTKLANTNEVTAARMAALTDWIDGGRLDLLLDTLLTRLSAARSGYLDNLNIGQNVAGTSEVTSIQNNTRCVRSVPAAIERPDSSTITYRVELLLYDNEGNMEAPDSAPTLALENQTGTDRSSRLDSTTGTLVETGRYRWVYTSTSTDDVSEQLNWTFTVVEGGNTRKYTNQSLVVDTTAVDFTAADRTKLEAIQAKLPSADYLTGTSQSDGSGFATAATLTSVANNVVAILIDTGTSLPLAIGTAQSDLDKLAGTDGAILATSQPNYAPAKAGDQMDLVDSPNATGIAKWWTVLTSGLTTVGSVGKLIVDYLDAAISSRQAAEDVYWAQIRRTRDDTNSRDEYTVRWKKNGANATVTGTPQIQIVSVDSGDDIVAATDMSSAGSGLWTYQQTSSRPADGAEVQVIVTATIDSSVRVFDKICSRDKVTS